MSQINSVGTSTPLQKVVENPISKEIPAGAPAQMRATDRLELSGASHLLATLKSDKVADIRQQIQNGTYDADGAKLDAAVDKLLDALGK